ncbi:MAG: hypothetical protein NT005_02270, partial [Spirochaetes bacterium]|nr:hypothetical protein [Spirochaetota bacterium]
DFTETFAVCLWRDWDPRAVDRLMQGKNSRCRAKLACVAGLIRREARLKEARRREARRGDSPTPGLRS